MRRARRRRRWRSLAPRRRAAPRSARARRLALAACGGEPRRLRLDARRRSSTRTATGSSSAGPGEPLIDRGTPAKLGRTLATFGQLTDTHVRDEESPARVPFLDRIGAPFTSTFRPQEAFSTQMLDASVRALNAQHPQAVFVTGDITDNAQRNELTWALATLKGGTVTPTAAPGYDGVQDARLRRPLLLPPRPRRAARTPARSRKRRSRSRRRGWTRRGIRSSATTTCSPRARSRPRRGSTRSPPAAASSRASTSSSCSSPAQRDEREGGGQRRARRQPAARHDQRARRRGPAHGRARRSREAPRPPRHGLHRRARPAGARRDGRHRRPRRHLARRGSRPRSSSGCGPSSRRRRTWARLLAITRSPRGPRRARRAPQRGRLDLRQHAQEPHHAARPLLAASAPPHSPTFPSRRACSGCARPTRGVALETWMVDHDTQWPRGHLRGARLPRRTGRSPAALRGPAPGQKRAALRALTRATFSARRRF